MAKRLRKAIANRNTNEIYGCIYDVDEAGKSAALRYAVQQGSGVSVQILWNKE